jgi:hypothetical protein
MCEPCQESSGSVYVCLVQIPIYTIATLLTWFTHIPPNIHIQNRYSADIVHTYTTKHTYTEPLLSWHGSHIYHQAHIYTAATPLTWYHVSRVAIVYMCIWWYMCELCQVSNGSVYVCLVVYVWTMSGVHTYTQPLLSWHGSHTFQSPLIVHWVSFTCDQYANPHIQHTTYNI